MKTVDFIGVGVCLIVASVAYAVINPGMLACPDTFDRIYFGLGGVLMAWIWMIGVASYREQK